MKAKLCPFCGKEPYVFDNTDDCVCETRGCPAYENVVTLKVWNRQAVEGRNKCMSRIASVGEAGGVACGHRGGVRCCYEPEKKVDE